MDKKLIDSIRETLDLTRELLPNTKSTKDIINRIETTLESLEHSDTPIRTNYNTYHRVVLAVEFNVNVSKEWACKFVREALSNYEIKNVNADDFKVGWRGWSSTESSTDPVVLMSMHCMDYVDSLKSTDTTENENKEGSSTSSTVK